MACIRARGIIVNYDYMIIFIMLITCHFPEQLIENLIPSINATGVKYFYYVTMNWNEPFIKLDYLCFIESELELACIQS